MGIAIAIFCSRSDGPPSCWIGQPKPSSSSGRTNGVQYRARYFDARPHPSRLGVAAAGGVPSKKTEIVAAVRPRWKGVGAGDLLGMAPTNFAHGGDPRPHVRLR